MDYIIALSGTTPEVYRQVTSLMGLQLVTSQQETTQRQLNVEKKKRINWPSFESLSKKPSMTHERIKVIKEMMRKLFTGFAHLFQDTDPDIRVSCIQSLGVWILLYPILFLQHSYLEYLGWTLTDTSAQVRKASVLALQNLYEVDDNVPSLGPFTERFYEWMLEFADDLAISMAVCAIGLVKQLMRHQLIPDNELSSLYELLIDNAPEIRRAIRALVYDHLIAQKFSSSQSTGDGDDSLEVQLRRMLQILRPFLTDQIISTYIIDNVWEYMDAMKNWKCIISMLLDKNPSSKLSDVDATSLIRLICSSVEKALGERIVPATDNRKQNYTKAQQEMFENNRRDITIAMMKNYPQILHKFMDDKKKSFKNVLKLIKNLFFKHGQNDALRSCIKAFNYCATESQGDLQDFALKKFKELENELIIKLRSAVNRIADGGENFTLKI